MEIMCAEKCLQKALIPVRRNLDTKGSRGVHIHLRPLSSSQQNKDSLIQPSTIVSGADRTPKTHRMATSSLSSKKKSKLARKKEDEK